MTEALQQEIRTLRHIFESERDPEGRVFAPLADAHRRAGELQQALALLGDGLSRHPEFVPGHVVAARLYSEQGLDAEASIAARRALELDAENVLALRSLLQVLERAGDGEAEGVRGQLIALDPDFAGGEAPPTEGVPPAAPPLRPSAEEDLVAEAERPVAAPPLAEEAAAEEAPAYGGAVTESGEPDEEPLIDLDALAPITKGEVSGEAVDEEPGTRPSSEVDLESAGEEPVLELSDLQPAPLDEAVDGLVGATLPEAGAMPEVDVPSGMDFEDEPVLELEDLAPAPSDDDDDVVTLDALAPEPAEPILELEDLAPAPSDDDDDVVTLDALAPDPVEPILELEDLAPAPSDDDDTVVTLDALAPEPAEPALELEDLAPAPSDDDTVVTLDALAPEPPDPGEAVDVEVPAADEGTGPSSDGADADSATEDAATDDEATDDATRESEEAGGTDESPGEPVYTRTLAELYVKQGAVDKALDVYRHLLETTPGDEAIEHRIEELESGAALRESEGHLLDESAEDEVEALARELAENGHHQRPESESPYTMEQQPGVEASGEPSISHYLEGLLSWKREEPS